MATDMSEFAVAVDEMYASASDVEFSPRCQYREETDSLFVFLDNELSFQRRVNKVLTVFVGDNSGEIVGVEIKGYRRLVDNMKKSGMGQMVHNHADLWIILGIAVNQDGEGEQEFPNLSRYLDVQVPKYTGDPCEYA